MAKQIARLLKADIQESSDLKSIAKMLSKKGRGGDTMLAHITPKEAKILKEAGGAGTVNPDTGLLEFYDGGFNIGSYGYDFGADYADYARPAKTYTAEMPTQQPVFDVTQYQAPGGYQASFEAPAMAEPTPTQTYGYGTMPSYFQEGAAPAPSVAPAPVDYSKFPYNFAITQPSGVPAAASTTYPEGMFDFPAGTAAEGPPAIVSPAAYRDLTPPSLADRAKSFAREYVKEPLQTLKETTGLSATDLIRLGGAGIGAVAGRQQAQQAAKQIQQATQEQKNLGKPYQEEGQKLQRAALAGELTPQSAQAYQALRAQMAQGIESRGGVGVAQAQAQLEAFRQNLLQNQYNFGLQVSQIGDNMALGAIRTGMQLDQQLAAANQQFYTQLAAIAGGGTYGYQPPTRTTGGQ